MFIFPIPLPAPRASAHTICCCELGLLALLLLLCFISFAQKKISGRSAPPASPASTNYHETVFRKKFHRHRRRKKNIPTEQTRKLSGPRKVYRKSANGKTLPIFISLVVRPGNRSPTRENVKRLEAMREDSSSWFY